MKRAVSIFLVMVLLVACLFAGAQAHAQVEEERTPQVNCTLQVLNIVCVEAGVTILSQPVTLPTVRVTVPGPTETATITTPASPRPTVTRTVEGPGSTETVRITQTAPGAPGAIETIREPGSVLTQTIRPTAGPSRLPEPAATVTVTGLTSVTTVTATPRQSPAPSATLDPSSDGLIPRDTPPVVVTGIGLGVLAILAGLILFGMYGGYYIGYKDSDKADANFFRALLNKQ